MTIRDHDYEYVRTIVRARTAIVLGSAKNYLIDGRLASLARSESIGSVPALLDRARSEPGGALESKVVEAMITQETSFFRDGKIFDALRDSILPDLLEKRARGREITLWCAASATGQEPYSLAILLREHFPSLRDGRLLLVASDVSSAALARAREGRFRPGEMRRGLPEEYRDRYFRKEDHGYRIRDEIRDMVRFRRINLARAWPDMPPMDVVLMRNVLIYFDVDMKREILEKTKKVLRQDGHLFLGAAETTFYLDGEYERVRVLDASCYRLRARKGDGGEQGNGPAGVLALAGEASRRD